MALRIGLPGSSAMQNDGHIKPVMLQCRTPRDTNPKGHWGAKLLLEKTSSFSSPVVLVCLGSRMATERNNQAQGHKIMQLAISEQC